ncbi:hypothetical protein BH10ACT7_BH10ACT7_29810 [soil metagenome]
MATEPVAYLIDNSVWARLSTNIEVVTALKAKVDLVRPDNVMVCPPIILEFGFSARTGPEHSALMTQLEAFAECGTDPDVADAMLIQNRLWSQGLVRAAGPMDTLIAAYAIRNNATLLHYDRDYEHIASVMPDFRHEWIVPRGSVA